MMSMKKWRFWLGLLLSVGFMYLSLRGLRLGEIWDPLMNARYGWLFPGVMVYFLAVTVRSGMWQFLLRPIKSVPILSVFPMVAIGYMGNNIYPARAGEVLRAVVLKRREGVSISASLATIIVERVFDGVVMLGFIFLNLSELSGLGNSSGLMGSIQAITVWGSAAFLGALAVFLAAAMFPARAEQIVRWLAGHIIPKRFRKGVLKVSLKFLTGLESLRSPQDAIIVLLISAVSWLLETGFYWFVMQAFDFQVSFFALMLMTGIINLATIIPSAPGYIGTFHATGIAVLVAYGVSQGLAAGYILVLHAVLWLPITVLGGYFLAKEGIRWSEGEVVEQERGSEQAA